MKGFADTSFLLSLALQDEHLAEARRWWKRVNLTLHTSSLVPFEAENALRNMLQRGLLDEQTYAAAVLCLDRMIRDGSILPIHFQTRLIIAEARRLFMGSNLRLGGGSGVGGCWGGEGVSPERGRSG